VPFRLDRWEGPVLVELLLESVTDLLVRQLRKAAFM
jgi:hypothetical protein